MKPSSPTALLLALALALVARPAMAAPVGGDERSTPTYQALAKVMEELQRGVSPRHLEPQIRALAPLVEGLDRRFGRDLRRRLDQAMGRADRAAFLDALVQLIVEEGLERLAELKRDEYYGWRDGQGSMRRFALRYQLVSGALRAVQPAQEEAIRQRLEGLSLALQRADLTTDPAEIEAAVVPLRERLSEVKPITAPLRPRFRLVVNAANPVVRLTREAASRLFLKKTTAWPDGLPVEPVEQDDAAPAHESYCLEVHDRNPTALRAAWNQIIFSGQAVPPPEVHTDEEVVAFVKGHPGAIGYVSKGAAAAGVKVIPLED